MEERKRDRIYENIKRNFPNFRLAVFSFIYGLWIHFNPDILIRYSIYELIESIVSYHFIGLIFIVVSSGLIIGSVLNKRGLRNFFSVLLTAIWTTFAISFFITPPINTIWLYTGFIAILCYEAIWND